MIIIHQPALLHSCLQKHKQSSRSIGFAPTMGALHEGHISLINQSKIESEVTVCSIFVNPAQFNESSDFDNYPNRIDNDIRLLERAGTDFLFLPDPISIYPSGTTNLEHYNLGYLETVLEGEYRPGHFQGVCQVMSRLLKIVAPKFLFMGRKDYQQCMVVRKMMTDLNMNIQLVSCNTLREADGLAMSSRNLRLTPAQRKAAPALYRVLLQTKNTLHAGNVAELRSLALSELTAAGFKPDYFEIADASDLKVISEWDGKTPVIALVAAYIGEVRLIDNMMLHL